MAKEIRGIRNNNPLNIIKGNNWQGERNPQTDKVFEEFKSMEYGIRAGFIIMRNNMRESLPKYRQCNTIRKLITRWAPPSENATDKYIEFVCKKSGLLPDEEIRYREKSKMCAICDAMIRMECGKSIDLKIIQSAYDMTF